MKTTLEIIEGALEIIKDPQRWGQRDFAFAADGTRTGPGSTNAVRWCVVGAMMKVAGKNVVSPEVDSALGEVLHYGFARDAYGSLSAVNDIKTHEEIVAAVEKTIAALKEQKP